MNFKVLKYRSDKLIVLTTRRCVFFFFLLSFVLVLNTIYIIKRRILRPIRCFFLGFNLQLAVLEKMVKTYKILANFKSYFWPNATTKNASICAKMLLKPSSKTGEKIGGAIFFVNFLFALVCANVFTVFCHYINND